MMSRCQLRMSVILGYERQLLWGENYENTFAAHFAGGFA